MGGVGTWVLLLYRMGGVGTWVLLLYRMGGVGTWGFWYFIGWVVWVHLNSKLKFHAVYISDTCPWKEEINCAIYHFFDLTSSASHLSHAR